MNRFCFTVLALLAFTPAMAAPTTFWTFGFYFPDRAHNHAGGFSRLDHGEAPSAAAPIELAGLYQISERVTPVGLLAAWRSDSTWQTRWSLPCRSRFAPTLTPPW